MGMEADAGWAVDPTGQEIAFCCFVARLRDWARLGLMLAHDGAWNGRQIVPRQWVVDSTTSDPADPWSSTRRRPRWGYGNQIWLSPSGARTFMLRGVHGQMMFIDPASKLVLLQTAVFIPAGGPTLAEAYAVWNALLAQ